MSFTDNVIQFMVQDLGRLEKSASRLLQLGALFGSKFDIRDVAHVGGGSEGMSVEQAESDLWEALHEGKIIVTIVYLLRLTNGVSISLSLNKTQLVNHFCRAHTIMLNNKQKGFVIRRGDFHYSFLHDRIQEAAKSAIPDKIMTQLHLEIGLFLLDKIKNLKRNLRVISFNPIKLYLPFLFQ